MKQLLIAVLSLLASAAAVVGQEAQSGPPSGGYVSREEYEKLKGELDELKAQMTELARTKSPPPAPTSSEPPPPAEGPDEEPKNANANGATTATDVEELRSELAKVKEATASITPGTTRFLITGYGFAGFSDLHGEPSTFTAGFAPIFLWKLSDKLFFEGELEFEQTNDETEVNLEYAHLTYILNDYITLGAGKFLTPFAQFPDRLHAAWINKLPDFPLVFAEDSGLIGFSSTGARIGGALPIGPTKLIYDLYVSNGPRLITDDPEALGMLAFNNFTDIDNNKAVGGRIGFLPIPQLEVAYSVQSASARADDTSRSHADVLLQAVDMSYLRDIDFLKGGIDLRAEWVWSRVSRLTYDPDGTLGFGPLTFSNRRSGGYAQLAYRPYKIKAPVIDKLEAVVRYDTLDQPAAAPGTFDEERWTIGLNYWLGQSTVIKAGYEFGHRHSPAEGRADVDGFLIQAAMGF